VFSQPVRAGVCAFYCALSACSGNAPASPQKSSAPKYSLDRPVEGLPLPVARDDSFRRGVSLDLFVAEVDDAQRAEYSGFLDHAARLGATDLELVVQWSAIDASSVELAPSPGMTVDDDFLGWLMDQASSRQLRVLLTPLIELEQAPQNADKRALAPSDAGRWFWSYHRFLLHYARIAEAHKAVCFAVGADLPLALAQDEHWLALITDVRKAYKGKLTYVARAEHFESVGFWQEMDFVGLSGVGELLADPSKDAARAQRRAELGKRLRSWLLANQKPYLLSSVHADFALVSGDKALTAQGSSREQTNALAIKQLDAVRAFYQALNADKALAGVYLSLARPGSAAKPIAATPQVASASAEVLKHWYTRSRGPLN
jgi:hypothetical protein